MARRRARGAGDHGRRRRHGRDDPPNGEGARRRSDRRGRAFPDRPRRRRRRRLRACRGGGGSAARRRAAGAGVHSPAGRGSHVRGEDHRGGPRARLGTSGRGVAQPSARAFAAHRRARSRRRATARRLADTRGGRAARAPRGPTRGETADDVRRVPSRTAMNAREAAYEVVLRVFEDDAYADRVFRSASRGLDSRDRALAQRLAYGTVQRVRTLDYAIEQLGRRPVRKLDPPVRAALRLGAYQLGYAERIATHAAVNETVELVRRARLERAVAFTNAVLRRLAEGMRELVDALPDGPLRHSYPDWIADVWTRDLGEDDTLALMRAQNEPPETVVRLVRGDPPGGPTDVPGAYRVDRLDEDALAAGRIWPQSRGSQLAGLVVGAREGERTLDLCAAPGGQATQPARGV